ncbi:MAG: flagellar protein FliS [Oscillospiraceae bacterium]|nr:flagellar protein FliS [Oscillospiraceae bacterium]
MNTRGYQQYKQQSLNTMTPGELLLLVLDELVKRLLRGDLALQQQNYELFDASIDRCIAIVRYLDDTLDRKYEISRELHRLYEFFSYDLNRIKIGRNQEELNRLRPLIIDLRDTFRIAERNVAEQNGANATSSLSGPRHLPDSDSGIPGLDTGGRNPYGHSYS